MKIITALVLSLLLPACSHAFDINLKEDDAVIIKSGYKLKKIRLNIVINGYSVKCDGSKIIIWGKPKKINKGNPQDTNVILLDLANNYREYMKGLSGCVFDVDYLKVGDKAYIGSGQGVFIDLSDGHLKEVTSEFDPSDKNNFESCQKNESWDFNRYP